MNTALEVLDSGRKSAKSSVFQAPPWVFRLAPRWLEQQRMPKVPRIVDYATDASSSPLGCEFILMESQQMVEDMPF